MNETLLQELEAYAIACDVCASLLVQSPTKESLDSLTAVKYLLLEEPFVSISADAASQMVEVLDLYLGNPEQILSELRQDYTFLFYMVSVSKASPFESVYVTEDRTLCGPAMVAVRKMYQKWGVSLPEDAATLEDHMGYELSFVAHLLRLAVFHIEQNQSYDEELAAVGIFITEHINAFADEYYSHAESAARTKFFCNVMKLSHALTQRLTERFV